MQLSSFCSRRSMMGLFLLSSLASCVFFPAAQAQLNAFNVTTYRPWSNYAIPNGEWRTLDFNGDGRDDVIHIVANTDYIHTWQSNANGTFKVSTFRPWSGYGMPNGLWLVADINGDKKDDMVHAVRGRDYVHTWISQGNGKFTVGTFRPWKGYSIPNGLWKVLDINGDTSDDIVHIVSGTDYVHTWMSLGNGTFKVGTFKPWNGYSMPNGIWLSGDIDNDGDDDLVHAVNKTDYVHTWRSRGNGTFTVGTFRPWNGYAIPNGEWRMLDSNADGRDDIVHVVSKTDYVHTWLSRGDGKFTVSTFRPWSGYAMPNGLWLTGDFNKDGRDDMVHAVKNKDYLHTWLSQGNGKFEIGTFSPWSGYAIPNGLWLTGDHNGDGKTDIVHAVNKKDYVHPWLSQLAAPGQSYLEGIEITQVVQNMDHTVPIVGNKGTVVRAYPAFRGAGSRTVRGRLYVRNTNNGPWTLLNSLNTATVTAANNGNLRVKRENTNQALNFRVPQSHLREGKLTSWFADMSDAGSGTRLDCAGCWGARRTVSVGDDNSFRLRVLGMRYTNGTPPATFQPRALDYNLLESWLERVYPTGDLQYGSATVNSNLNAPFGCGDVNARLTAIRNADTASGRDRRTHYYGMTFDDADSRSFFMRGCAAGIPGTPSPATVASGPTGANWGWDTDGSYGDWYGGHELGHTLGRFHIGSGCGESDDDPSYPYPNGQISPNNGEFVGFDLGDAAFGIAMRALPGTQWTDVMSYCANQWISDYTYERMRTRIAAEDNLPAGATPAVATRSSMLASAAELQQIPEIVEGEPPAAGDPVGTGMPLGVFFAPAGNPVTDVQPERSEPPGVPEPAYDQSPAIVTGGEPPIMDERTATRGGETMMLEQYQGPMRPDSERDVVEAARPDAPTEVVVPTVVIDRQLLEGDFLAIAGTANLTQSTGKFVDVRRVKLAEVPTGPVQSKVRLRALDKDAKVLNEWQVPFLPNSEREPHEDVKGVVDAVIPFAPEIRTIELLINDVTADTFSAPVSAPGIRLEAIMRGEVAVESSFVSENQLSLKWADQVERLAGLTYDVQVRRADQAGWDTLAIGLVEPQTILDLAGYKGQAVLHVRIIANRGFDTRVIATRTINMSR